MGQYTINTLGKTDRDSAMVALHAIAKNNGEDLLFCPISDYNDKISIIKKLNAEISMFQEDNMKINEELNKLKRMYSALFENNKTLNTNLTICEKNNEELKAVIKDLKEKLSAFIPGYGGESELIYFKPCGERLETTTIHANALFVGVSVGENVFEFQFNEEKGPHVRAIQTRQESLAPFCDIEYNAPDGNYVKNGHKGSFSMINGQFKIIKKAIISIVKK